MLLDSLNSEWSILVGPVGAHSVDIQYRITLWIYWPMSIDSSKSPMRIEECSFSGNEVHLLEEKNNPRSKIETSPKTQEVSSLPTVLIFLQIMMYLMLKLSRKPSSVILKDIKFDFDSETKPLIYLSFLRTNYMIYYVISPRCW